MDMIEWNLHESSLAGLVPVWAKCDLSWNPNHCPYTYLDLLILLKENVLKRLAKIIRI